MSTHRVWTRFQRFVALAAVAACLIGAGIPLTSYLVNQGTFSPFGQTDVAMPDSNYTLLAADYAPRALRFTGALTADRNATVPLEKGISYEVTNATTGGFNILFGGASGARATIPASATAPIIVHSPDGANFYLMSGGGSGLPTPLVAGSVLDNDGGVAYWANTVSLSSVSAGTLAFTSGNAPGWGRTTDAFPSNANYTAPSSVYNFHEISVSGTQTSKNYVLPLTAGSEWVVTNATTSDFQVIGASGTGAWIPKNGSCYVRANGTNLLGLVCTNGARWVPNEYDAGGVVTPIPGTQVCISDGSSQPVCTTEAASLYTDATTWQTIAQFQTRGPNTVDHVMMVFMADDFSADGGGGVTKNFVKANLEVHVHTDEIQTMLTSQAGNDFRSDTISLSPIANTDMTGCTSPISDAGCSPGQTTTWTFQATLSGSFPTKLVQVQAKAVGTTAWPWKGTGVLQDQRVSYP